ncbi:unannotated protein [freshwater metagenome]|uniref:Unannotated protein n=1 Tax=freshwater metagenome TaxID=449393 RepID=A0A6J6NYK8_9ZZZZ
MVVTRPPAKAQIAIVQVPAKVRSKTITEAAATAAPDDTPTTPGSASGLPKTPCISAPPVASAAPAIAAITTRGKRTFHSVVSPWGWAGTGPRSSPTRCSTEPITSDGATSS